MPEFDPAVDDPHKDNYPFVGVEPGVEDESAEGSVRVAGGRRDALDDLFEDLGDADSLFGRAQNGFGGVETDESFNLFADAFGVSGGQIDLVDDGDDLEILIERKVGVGEGLGFDALRSIDDEEGTFAGLERAGDFVGEVYVTRGINEIELVNFSIFCRVEEANGMGFDGDAAFAFEVHGVKDLGHHLALGEGSGMFEESVGERRLAVVDVGDDGEVSNV